MASELRVNTLKDASGNNSIATSVVFGGVAKCWGDFDQDTPSVKDSFNSTTVTDGGTGIITINFTNNMSAGTYAPHCNGINGDHLIASAGNVVSASCKFGHYTQGNAVVDTPYGSYSMLGDLA